MSKSYAQQKQHIVLCCVYVQLITGWQLFVIQLVSTGSRNQLIQRKYKYSKNISVNTLLNIYIYYICVYLLLWVPP